MVVSWAITEVIRYGHYTAGQLGLKPYVLLWLRYDGRKCAAGGLPGPSLIADVRVRALADTMGRAQLHAVLCPVPDRRRQRGAPGVRGAPDGDRLLLDQPGHRALPVHPVYVPVHARLASGTLHSL